MKSGRALALMMALVLCAAAGRSETPGAVRQRGPNCSVALAGYGSVERAAWREICAGRPADLKHQVLNPAFIIEILSTVEAFLG